MRSRSVFRLACLMSKTSIFPQASPSRFSVHGFVLAKGEPPPYKQRPQWTRPDPDFWSAFVTVLLFGVRISLIRRQRRNAMIETRIAFALFFCGFAALLALTAYEVLENLGLL